MAGFAVPLRPDQCVARAQFQVGWCPEEAPVRTAIVEAERLDQQEAPQREIERIARENEAERAKFEKARLVNKPRFRP